MACDAQKFHPAPSDRYIGTCLLYFAWPRKSKEPARLAENTLQPDSSRAIKTRDGEVCWQKPERKLARSVENFDPELEHLIMPLDIPDQIVAKFGFVTFTQNLSVEFL